MIESNFIEISNVHNGVFKKFDTKVNGNLAVQKNFRFVRHLFQSHNSRKITKKFSLPFILFN